MAIALGGQAAGRRRADAPEMVLGGYTALAESAWMGAAQASDVLESLRAAPAGRLRRPVLPRLPRIRLAGLLTRELSIAEATFVLMGSFFVSALLGAIRQVLFNAAFGAGAEASAYYAAFRLPDTLFSLIAGGALSSAMIPVLLRTIQEDGAQAGRRLINLIMTALLAVFALVVVFGEIFTPFFVAYLLAPGFDAPTSQLTVALTRVMLLQPLILAIGSVATAVLNSRNQFVLTALSVASHNVALIAGILAARVFPDLGIYGPTLGVVGGAILQVLILLPGLLGRRPDERKDAPAVQLVVDLADRRLREVARLLIPNGLSVGVNYAGFILDTAFASKAAEIAGLSAIQNAWLLVGLPIALLGQAVGQSAFPRLAAHAAAAEWRLMGHTLLRSLGAVVALAVPALLGLIFLGRLIIHLLFERGKFDAAAGALTYNVLVAYAVALPLYVATEVITRGLIALGDTRTPLATNTAQIAGRALMLALLIAPLGVLAIPVAFAVTASLETIVLGSVLLLKLRRLAR
jgi:putative peptidoglycan lipid II flippase